MFFLTHRQAKELRSMLRATLLDEEPRGQWPIVHFQARPTGVTVEAQKGEIALRWRLPYRNTDGSLAFRSTVLADLEGPGNVPIRLDALDSSHGRAAWESESGPKELKFETVDSASLPSSPKAPLTFRSTEPEFPAALREAYRTTAKSDARRSLSRIQLRGKCGELIATDGRQLLIHRGFTLPWDDDVLIPSPKLFGRKSAWTADDFSIGRSSSHVFLRCGAWDVALQIDTETRYPDVDKVLPKSGRARSRVVIDHEDALSLLGELRELPGKDIDHAPITLAFQSPPLVGGSGSESDEATVIELARSFADGSRLRVCQDRKFLGRALELGFREIRAAEPESPLWSYDSDRLYLWMPLDQNEALSVHSKTSCPITSNNPSSTRQTTHTRRGRTMPSRNGTASDTNRPEHTLDELIAQAEGMRQQHQEAGSRLSQLLASLKAHRKQSRALRQAVASIKHLDLGD